MDEEKMQAEITDCLKAILTSLRTSSTAESEVSEEASQAHIENVLQRGLRNIGAEE